MLFKDRFESDELKRLKLISYRKKLLEEDGNYLSYLEKGFEGEKKFDELVESLSSKWLILNDLLLECNKTTFQLDSVGINNKTIYHFEVKNYEGDFYVEGDNWYTLSNKLIKNPFNQLIRNQNLLQQLLHDLGFNYVVESYLVFVNPEFHLYQAPKNLPIIYPAQITRFIKKLNMKHSKLLKENHHLASKLLSLHIEKSPFTKVAEYHYDELEKGIFCFTCRSLNTSLKPEGTIVCIECGFKENVNSAVLRSVDEYLFLFPDRKITTNSVYDWCKVIESRKTIRGILKRNFKLIGCTRSSYFVRR